MAAKKPTKKAPANAGAIESEEACIVYIQLAHQFDLASWKAWLESMPAGKLKVAMTDELAKLYAAAKAGNHALVDSILNNLDARRKLYEVMPLAKSGLKVKNGGKKGGSRPRAASKADSILKEANKYNSISAAKIATIVRNSGATPQYVRKVLKKNGK